MAKIVCKNCGTKNQSSAAVCSNCGNFLFDEPVQTPQAVTESIQEENTPQSEVTSNVAAEATEQETRTYTPTGNEETILVKGGNSAQWIGMASAFGILAVFLGLTYVGFSLPTYTTYIFIVLIFVLPSALRKLSTSVKFTGTGFMIPGENQNVNFNFEDIMNVTLGQYNRGSQSLTLFFKGEQPAVTLDFHSFNNYRTLVMMFNRRRIPVTRDRSNYTPGNTQI